MRRIAFERIAIATAAGAAEIEHLTALHYELWDAARQRFEPVRDVFDALHLFGRMVVWICGCARQLAPEIARTGEPTIEALGIGDGDAVGGQGEIDFVGAVD